MMCRPGPAGHLAPVIEDGWGQVGHHGPGVSDQAGCRIEVEVESMAELDRALAAGADVIMLDNFDLASIREAARHVAGRAILEASGGITLENIADVAETGIDVISIGALTHSSPAIDISVDLELLK